MEQEAHPTRPARPRAQEVDADETGLRDLEPALLADLAPARLPRRLTNGVDLATRDGPALLVVRLEDQQLPVPIEDQPTSRRRDPGDLVCGLCGLGHICIIPQC